MENLGDLFLKPSDESSFIVPWPIVPQFAASDSVECQGFPSWAVPVESVAEDRATAVSKSHSQAEKRRRDRINTQLSALRKLIPKSDKMDKAALLGSAIEHVKDLKRKATEVSKAFSIPTEVDEVTVDYDNDKMLIRASVCCDDRPEVLGELIRVLKALSLSTVKADISSVGGRMKSNLILCNNNSEEQGVSPNTLKQSLNAVLNRIASSSSATSNCRIRSKRIASSSSAASNCRIRSKRQRIFYPSQLHNNLGLMASLVPKF